MPRSTASNNSFTHGGTSDRAGTVEQMQQQADQYTRKYEWERRNLITTQTVRKKLMQAINHIEGDIEKTKASVMKLKRECEQGEMKVTFTKMRNLQKQIDAYDKRYNDTLGEIEKVKTEITALRQARLLYKENLTSVEEDIAHAEQQLDNIFQDIEQEQNVSKTSQNAMLELKMQNQRDKTDYYIQLNKLNQELRQKKLNMGNRSKPAEVNALQNDTATVLKRRLTKLIVNNKEKVRLIDNYQRNMKVIDEAFNTIKQATGLTDIEQIQNIFIKGEEQNYGLLTYVDVLNQEIDNLEDMNLHLREKNQSMKVQNSFMQIDIAQKQRIFNGTPDQQRKRKKITQMIESKKVEIGHFEKLLEEIEPRMQQVLIKLAKSKLNHENPSLAAEYQAHGINLNESSLDQYLSELEQYTNKILFGRAKLNNESTTETLSKTLLLDELPAKDGKRRVIDNQVTPEDDVSNYRELLDKTKLDELANRQIERFRNAPQKEKGRAALKK